MWLDLQKPSMFAHAHTYSYTHEVPIYSVLTSQYLASLLYLMALFPHCGITSEQMVPTGGTNWIGN